MRIEGFLKVPDIPGPSERVGHENEIEVHGVAFGMEAPVDPRGLARRAKATFDLIVFTKYYDMASPYLKKALADNTPFDDVVFSARRASEDRAGDYLVITLTRGSATKYEMHPADDEPDRIEERVGFVFQAIEFAYEGTHRVELSLRDGGR